MNRSLTLFDLAFRLLIGVLPFIVLLSVFTSQKLGIPWVSYVKEILLIIMGGYIIWKHIKGERRITWTWFDLLFGGYVVTLVVITLFTTGTAGLIYGGRYDFEFLYAFLVLLHGVPFLRESSGYYIRLFLIAWGISLFCSLLVRFVFHPDILLYFWFSWNPSNWQFGVTPPIFHWVDGANVQRFQGILDGPNSMGAFLIIYTGILVYYMRKKTDWYFLVGCFVLLALWLEFLTYSRSALWGFILGFLTIFISSLWFIIKKYKKEFYFVGVLGIIAFWMLSLQYFDKAEAILAREGSSRWHFSRMITGLERFWDHPLGQGLWSSWPWYRYVLEKRGFTQDEIMQSEPYYIPESWYIQQWVEGWIIGFLFFAAFFLILASSLSRLNIILFSILLWICGMNFFLHTFEVTYLSIWIFSFFGMVLGYNRLGRFNMAQWTTKK